MPGTVVGWHLLCSGLCLARGVVLQLFVQTYYRLLSAFWHFYKQCLFNSFRQVIWLECESKVSFCTNWACDRQPTTVYRPYAFLSVPWDSLQTFTCSWVCLEIHFKPLRVLECALRFNTNLYIILSVPWDLLQAFTCSWVCLPWDSLRTLRVLECALRFTTNLYVFLSVPCDSLASVSNF